MPSTIDENLGPVVIPTRVVGRVVAGSADVSERTLLARFGFPRGSVALVPVGRACKRQCSVESEKGFTQDAL